MFVSSYVYYMFTILDYSSALEYSIIRRYTNIVYCILLLVRIPKILGVYLDTYFSFNNNCVQVANRVNKRNNALQALAVTNWGQQKETLLMTYKALGRSIANYPAPCLEA